MIPELYGFAHKTAKKILKRSNDLPDTVKLVSFPEASFSEGVYITSGSGFVNEVYYKGQIKKSDVYPVENLVFYNSSFQISFSGKSISFGLTKTIEEAKNKWEKFITSASIPKGYRNENLLYTGFIKEEGEWCLPSWIWTNAAIVRWYCANGEIEKAKYLGNRLISLQQECGGWIVRNDYNKEGVSPQLAPNDSCYIALNCCMRLYQATGEEQYLSSAERCATWVIETAREDGLVWFAYNTRKREWEKNSNIVDTGFTAGLFAKLYEITGKEKYKAFLVRFVNKYIEVFYMPMKKCFSTAIDNNDKQYGGAFGRGQGWALEGLIPAYKVLKDENIKNVIKETITTLLHLQTSTGGWSYNLLRPLMGEDCKAVPVIAHNLLEWYEIDRDEHLIVAARRALDWCVKHTAADSAAEGGIFSYTTEGAVVHHMYTSTAFTYGSSYALETELAIRRYS